MKKKSKNRYIYKYQNYYQQRIGCGAVDKVVLPLTLGFLGRE